MYCPLMKGREKAYCCGECEKNNCALWDEIRSQCAIKTFLIPSQTSSQTELNELKNLMMIDDMIKSLTNTSKRITEECETYLRKEGVYD